MNSDIVFETTTSVPEGCAAESRWYPERAERLLVQFSVNAFTHAEAILISHLPDDETAGNETSKWIAAMKRELPFINGTLYWKEVSRSHDEKVLHIKIVLRLKKNKRKK